MIHWTDPDVRVNINISHSPLKQMVMREGVVKRWQCGKYLMRRNRVISTWCVTGLKTSFSSSSPISTWSRKWAKKKRRDEVNRRNVNVHFFSRLCVAFESRIREKKNRLICLFGFGWFCTVISAHENWNTVRREMEEEKKKRKNEVYVYIEHIFWDMRELTVSSEMRDVCVHSFHLFFFGGVREFIKLKFQCETIEHKSPMRQH